VIAMVILLLLLIRCSRPKTGMIVPSPAAAPIPAAVPVAQPTAIPSGTKEPDEVLTTASVQTPAQVVAGAAFQATWTGPAN